MLFGRLAIRCHALAALCAIVLGSVGPAFAGDHVRVAMVSSSLASAPVVVAMAKGFFTAEGIDVELVPFESAQPISVAAMAGDVDFGTTGFTGAFFTLAHQGALTIIGGGSAEKPGFLSLGFVVSNQAAAAGLKSYGDFPGRSVGITQLGTPLHYVLATVLQKHGVDLKSVRVLGLQSNANVVSALIGGQVDAGVMSSANLMALVNKGGGHLLGWLADELSVGQIEGTFATTKIANERPDTVRHFLTAFRRGARTWDTAFVDADGKRADQPNAAEMIAIVAQGLNQPVDAVRLGVNYYEPDARVSVSGIQRMIDWYVAQGMLKTPIDANSLIDKRYVELATDGS